MGGYLDTRATEVPNRPLVHWLVNSFCGYFICRAFRRRPRSAAWVSGFPGLIQSYALPSGIFYFRINLMRIQYLASIFILFSSMALLNACDRVVVNSSENDELIASVSNLPGGSNFKAIVPTIISKCANCHTHQAWYGYGETDYQAAGLVSPGNYESSKLYYRLSTVSEGPGPHNMPQGGGSAFTEEEAQFLANWITNFGI